MSGALRVETDGAVAVLTLDRADLGNSLDILTARALFDAVSAIAKDDRLRCLLLRAEGRIFCVGGDITGFAAAGDDVGAHIAELAGTMHKTMLVLANMAKPMITLVQGAAAGAGLGLALVGDIVLASPTAHFNAAYTALGVSPDCGLTWLLPRLVGARCASEMILTKRRMDAREAVAAGLISRVSDNLEGEGRKLAASLANSATGALGSSRRLLHASWTSDFASQLDAELAGIASSAASTEGREGIAAFLDRRQPDFSKG